jgi:sugar lactone lactonase YvrE
MPDFIKVDKVQKNPNSYISTSNNVLSIVPSVSIPNIGQSTNGAFRYTSQFEVYNGTQWVPASLSSQYFAAITLIKSANGVNNKVQSIGKQYGSLIDLVANGSSSNVTIDLSESNNFRINVTNTLNANISIAYSPLFSKASIIINRQNTAPWTVNNAAYQSERFSVAAQDTLTESVFFKTDGTKMFMVGQQNRTVYSYELSVPWNINTATYSSNSYNVNAQDIAPSALFFKPDGTRMFIIGLSNDRVFAYDLSDAWNVNSAVYYSNAFSISAQDGQGNGLYFKPDGTRMFISGNNNDAVRAYDLSIPWNINTAVYYSNSFSVAAQTSILDGLFFKDDGTKMFIQDGSSSRVYAYNLTVPWNINTASYSSEVFTVNPPDSSTTSLYIRPNGAKMYVLGGTDTVAAFNLLQSPQINFAANVQLPNNYVMTSNTYKRNTATLYYEILNVMGGSRYQVTSE